VVCSKPSGRFPTRKTGELKPWPRHQNASISGPLAGHLSKDRFRISTLDSGPRICSIWAFMAFAQLIKISKKHIKLSYLHVMINLKLPKIQDFLRLAINNSILTCHFSAFSLLTGDCTHFDYYFAFTDQIRQEFYFSITTCWITFLNLDHYIHKCFPFFFFIFSKVKYNLYHWNSLSLMECCCFNIRFLDHCVHIHTWQYIFTGTWDRAKTWNVLSRFTDLPVWVIIASCSSYNCWQRIWFLTMDTFSISFSNM